MGFFAGVGSVLSNWFTIGLFAAGLGVAAGLLIFVYVVPGQPKIGFIDIPFTVINSNSTYVITEYLNYARKDDSIKAVVVKLESPGGGAASSERLYREMARLREEKPVVLVMNGLVASGGYMMSMGASHTYAQTTSFVGNVGVVSSTVPLILPNINESVLFSGPYKIDGFDRTEWLASFEEAKESFVKIVATERGDRMLISEEELAEARIYTGLRAVKLGLVDDLGGDSDAFEKAADLAGIANYDLVDVNLEVLKQLVKDLDDVFSIAGSGGDVAGALALAGRNANGEDPGLQGIAAQPYGTEERLEALRGLALYGRLGANPELSLDGLPFDLNHPNLYYLYLGNAD